MKITTRQFEDVTILEFQGRLTIGEGDVQMREAVTEVLEEGSKKILLNFKGVKMMDSSGLGELFRCYTIASNQSAALKFLHVENKVLEVLEMTRLIGILDTLDDEIDALASFRAPMARPGAPAADPIVEEPGDNNEESPSAEPQVKCPSCGHEFSP